MHRQRVIDFPHPIVICHDIAAFDTTKYHIAPILTVTDTVFRFTMTQYGCAMSSPRIKMIHIGRNGCVTTYDERSLGEYAVTTYCVDVDGVVAFHDS